jgi:hypothetical protein
MLRFFILVIVLIASSFQLQSEETTYISIESYEDPELRDLSNFMNIDYKKIVCRDTNMRGKVFVLYLENYQKGKQVFKEAINEPGVEVFDIGDETPMYYIVDSNEKMGFKKDDSTFQIKIFGKKAGNDYEFKVLYSGIHIPNSIPYQKDWLLTETNNCGTKGMEIPVGKATPLIAYTPAASVGPMMSYCDLRAEKEVDWYEKYKIEEYYLITLEIMDPVGPFADEIIKKMEKENSEKTK